MGKWGTECVTLQKCTELTENELPKPRYLSYTAKRGCTQWSGSFTSGIGTLGYLSDVDVHALIWELLGFLPGCSIWKTFKQIKTDLHSSSVSVSLQGSTEPQNLEVCGHGLGTPALLSLAQTEFGVPWSCPWQWTVGILIPKQISHWGARALEVKNILASMKQYFPLKICFFRNLLMSIATNQALSVTKGSSQQAGSKGKVGRRQGWL